jgi:hypothetical protein
MVNQEILGGLISALERGESLKKAMMSMYSAGYKKEEIEEAAMATLGMDITSLKDLLAQQNSFNEMQSLMNMNNQSKIQTNLNPAIIKKENPSLVPIQQTQQILINKQPIIQNQNFQQPQLNPQNPINQQITIPLSNLNNSQNNIEQSKAIVKQKVSDYSSKKKKKESDAILILLILLLVFLVGILVSLFVFKDKLISLFSNLFNPK